MAFASTAAAKSGISPVDEFYFEARPHVIDVTAAQVLFLREGILRCEGGHEAVALVQGLVKEIARNVVDIFWSLFNVRAICLTGAVTYWTRGRWILSLTEIRTADSL